MSLNTPTKELSKSYIKNSEYPEIDVHYKEFKNCTDLPIKNHSDYR